MAILLNLVMLTCADLYSSYSHGIHYVTLDALLNSDKLSRFSSFDSFSGVPSRDASSCSIYVFETLGLPG